VTAYSVEGGCPLAGWSLEGVAGGVGAGAVSWGMFGTVAGTSIVGPCASGAGLSAGVVALGAGLRTAGFALLALAGFFDGVFTATDAVSRGAGVSAIAVMTLSWVLVATTSADGAAGVSALAVDAAGATRGAMTWPDV
jgi:hypothetical protein